MTTASPSISRLLFLLARACTGWLLLWLVLMPAPAQAGRKKVVRSPTATRTGKIGQLNSRGESAHPHSPVAKPAVGRSSRKPAARDSTRVVRQSYAAPHAAAGTRNATQGRQAISPPIQQEAPPPSYAVSPAPEVTPAGSETLGARVLPPAPAAPFVNVGALTPFFHALAAEQAQRGAPATDSDAQGAEPTSGSTVRILQFGDSHTAADLFTGAVRAHMQAHFGNGGLGFQYPGHPFAGYRLAGSARSQSSGWVTEGNHFQQLGDGELGLGGISISTTRPGERVTLSTTCTSLQVDFLRQPGGGRLRLLIDSAPAAEIDTGSSDTGPVTSAAAGTLTYACTAGFHDIELTTLDQAPVRLFGLVTEQPGVTYECLGINGAVAPLILRWNQPIFADYLRERDPALIVLAYGTNEAVYISTHTEEYAAQFRRILATLHEVVPNAAVLVLGPYDRAVRSAGYTVGRGRHRHTVYTWQTFSGTERINAIQRDACRSGGCAFYDEQARMGGAGTMVRWAAEGLGQGDHTHLTGAGYRTLADALYVDLLNAYTSYQQGTAATNPKAAPAAYGPVVSSN